MKLRMLVLASSVMTVAAFAQNPITADSPYQIRYASNLAAGDSFVNLSNTGARGGATNQSGTAASVPGSICANVYTFAPDEEIVSCCSCPVTPNGLVSLSVNADLVANHLGRLAPNSVVIKLVATLPVGNSCNNSAATVADAGTVLVPGMVAWGTTLHANGSAPAGTFGLTETAFTPAALSGAEAARLENLCSFILTQGSGFGVCNSCRLGGLGAQAQ